MNHIQPLGFHRVMEGNPIAAHDSPLFKCPTEVLAEIIDYLGANPADLASLAFVNSDCRQLARSWQFRKLTLDATPRATAIVAVLHSEAQLRQQNKLGLSLGACIRQIETSNDEYWKRILASSPRKPGFSTDDNSEEAWDRDEAKLKQWRRETAIVGEELDQFFRMVHQAMTNLPHLYALKLTETSLDQSLVNWLLSFTTVRHLKKARFNMTEEIPRTDTSVEWPLEMLDIQMSWEFQYGYERQDLDASQHWYHLLRPCAPSLQSLTLSHSRLLGAINEKPVSFSLQFPQLRHLHLDYLDDKALEASSLRSLILTSTWLSSLSLDFGNRQIREILQSTGRITTLKTLILNNTLTYKKEAEKKERISLSFLEANSQLNAFAFKLPTKPRLLEYALSKLRPSQLTKLSMTWEGKENPEADDITIQEPCLSEIPETSLRALSLMVSLEDLHLDCISTARMNVYMRDWYVDHNVLRQHLGPSLCKLKRLALTRDIYEYRVGHFPGMPADIALLPGMPTDFAWQFQSYTELRSDDEWWEMHVQHMREQAVQYAETFPRLEFLHIGEQSFGISRHEDSQIVLEETHEQELPWVLDRERS
ncbi:hypothetical protein F5883DRAFT_438381 [Diaporthe sp. PMI_573]|nr:hypothetical protein F5883DRAFT_438381 [Diaporthaceae sp. PMI_573]